MENESMKYYTTRSVAKMLDVKTGTVRGWIREGKMKAFKLEEGNHWRVSHEELTRFANESLGKSR